MGKDEREGRRWWIEDRRGAFFETTTNVSNRRIVSVCVWTVLREEWVTPETRRGERTPRRLTKERSGEKARDSVGKSGRLPDEDKHNSELSREAVGPLPLLTYFIRGKRGFVGARRGWRRWPWRIHARPCVISWLSSVERATQRVAHAREVRKSCGVNTRWWDTRVFHPSRSGFLQSRYLWSGPCFRPRAFSRPSRKPRDSFIIRSDFERTFRRRA